MLHTLDITEVWPQGCIGFQHLAAHIRTGVDHSARGSYNSPFHIRVYGCSPEFILLSRAIDGKRTTNPSYRAGEISRDQLA